MGGVGFERHDACLILSLLVYFDLINLDLASNSRLNSFRSRSCARLPHTSAIAEHVTIPLNISHLTLLMVNDLVYLLEQRLEIIQNDEIRAQTQMCIYEMSRKERVR